ncbi:histidinol-phosphate transaminase [Sphingobium lignivorans]|uniref:Histidinol-phosphate aminotransferase n=1 Tax=Sphingobium lignivorans TaxID=2735886 RepID=A0ABR6NAA6_9SPHN|nr:histidinol-phosphate transaminase [Sphingobium lignivorans]MBB5984207.1 histidinol-phosphate aminotransferase [Sphingobium lignivorans]
MAETDSILVAQAPVPKDWIMAIAPYVPGKSKTDDGRAVAKLSSNENPFGTSQAARDAFISAAECLERYPDAAAAELREALGAHYGIEPERIIYGTGSDEVLHLAAGAFAGPGDEIIYSRFGFSVYPIATRRVGATPVVAPDKEYATDVDAILARVTERTRLVFIANPNNPTGSYSTREDIARLHAGLPRHVLLVLDQAYTEYLGPDEDDGGLELARTQSNVLVTRTFSKIFGLAAERIGWGYASPEIIAAMHRIRAPFSFGIGAQRAAIAALADRAFVAHSYAHNRHWRDWFEKEIAALGNKGLRAVPSRANFSLVLFEGETSAETAYKGLMDAGYIVRWLPGQELPHGLRITIGTAEQMTGLVAALRKIVGAEA